MDDMTPIPDNQDVTSDAAVSDENDILDERILGTWQLYVKYGEMPGLVYLLQTVCPHLDMKAIPGLLATHPELTTKLKDAWQQRKFAGVRDMEILSPIIKMPALAFPELSEDPDALQQIPLPPNNESDRKDEIRDLAFIDSFEGKCPQTPQLLILLGADDRLKSFKFRDAEALLKKHPVLEKALLYSWQNKSFKRIRQLAILRPDVSSIIMPGPPSFEDQQMKATQVAWRQDYVGDAVEGLMAHIRRFSKPGKQVGFDKYANYAAIVQSSGTGKSRLVDEFAKKNLVIRMNFRNDASSGFPPSDRNVRDFFLAGGDRNALYWRSYAFLVSLFRSAKKKVLQIMDNQAKPTRQYIATEFRQFMIAGQTFQQHGSARTGFFNDVIKEAQKILQTEDLSGRMGKADGDPPDETSVFKQMVFEEAKGLGNVIEQCPSHRYGTRASENPTSYGFPVVFLEFDEAHPLAAARIADTKHTHFSELRRALRMLYEAPVFSLFLSTTGEISQFNPHQLVDPSARVIEGDLRLIPPYSDLGFDQAMAGHEVANGEKTIDEVTGWEFMSRLGRPLFGMRYAASDKTVKDSILGFAQMKLINSQLKGSPSDALSEAQKLACLSARLAIDFNSTLYIGQSQEHTQVERHMRICLNVDDSFETMKTIFPSEPLLAEAAAEFMKNPNYKFNAPAALKTTLSGFSINKGDRGELLALLLLCLARDAALINDNKAVTVYDFMEKLFPKLFIQSKGRFFPSIQKKGTEKEAFKSCYKDSYMYFNHFIKVHESAVLNREYLWRLFLRGAAVLCANSQEGVDILVPILYRSKSIAEWHITVAIFQIKDDPKYGGEPVWNLADRMDPIQLNIFNKGEEALPIIRTVFAVGSLTATLKRRPKNLEASKNSEFTSFDFWCAGLSQEHLGPITREEESTWEALRQASRGWKDIYRADATRAGLRRATCAGSATHADHWQHFTKDVPGGMRCKRKREDGGSHSEGGNNMAIEVEHSEPDVVMEEEQ